VAEVPKLYLFGVVPLRDVAEGQAVVADEATVEQRLSERLLVLEK